MTENYIINLNGLRYLLIDDVVYNGYSYYSAIGVNEKGQVRNNVRGILKKIVSNNKEYYDFIRNGDEYITVTKMLADKLTKLAIQPLYEVGTVVGMSDGKDWIILNYIPYSNNMYAILMTASEPLEIMVARIEFENNRTEFSFVDVSGTENAKKVILIHQLVYMNEVYYDEEK